VALTDAGLRVHSMSPRALADVGPAVRELAAIVDADVPAPFGPAEWDAWLRVHAEPGHVTRRCVTFVWRRPWMALGQDTYGSSVLDALGHENAVAAGVRYPELTLAEVAACGTQVVLLPSEPYAFAPRHLAEVREAVTGVDVRLVDGQDLFWWGTRTPDAVERVRTVLR
jgi:ABC-type hemin transport system substrate-binding protein